jgi:hypothetical protein
LSSFQKIPILDPTLSFLHRVFLGQVGGDFEGISPAADEEEDGLLGVSLATAAGLLGVLEAVEAGCCWFCCCRLLLLVDFNGAGLAWLLATFFVLLAAGFVAPPFLGVAAVDLEKKEKRLPCFNVLVFFAGGAMLDPRLFLSLFTSVWLDVYYVYRTCTVCC